ncbi:hypothetical protein BLNAU_17519 [Blattamonas nauphoetae]|uniref:Protein kinase domain-containing protein n=1 Tax=Blattamonas nauphoetae TaxID=2049346 RepID=A0ABQ9X705_9EUKA|nr:hypothetical protein BLNAU_17519 [Blattamonas nauphoetae]
MNIAILILVHLLCVEAKFRERRILPLSLQMTFAPDAEAAHISRNKQAFVPEINLNHGTYHSNAYTVESVSLSLHGSDTTICHTSSLTKTETSNSINRDDLPDGNRNTTPFIFVFSNCTMSMSHISLDCGWRGTSVGRISSSRLTIDHCPIISNPESSPFAMVNGWDGIGISIFFVDCSHESIDKSSLLALVSLAPSLMTHSRHTNTEQEVSSTLVSCSGLSLCDAHLVSGYGPLVGFSSSTEQNTGLWKNLETVLMGSRLVNMTSGELTMKGKGALERWCGCQKIVDSCVTQSTNHLYGTTCIDMNLGGSLLCSNTSFSHCNREYIEPLYDYYNGYILQHVTGEKSDMYFGQSSYSSLIVRRCTFLSTTHASSGGGFSAYETPGDISMSECSFSKCSANYGGAVSVSQMVEGYSLSISSSLFVDCAVTRNGGAIEISEGTSVTIADVFMRNNTAESSGGSISVFYAKEPVLSNCVIEACAATSSHPEVGGGGIHMYRVDSTKMDSVLFRKCSAKQGNDMYFYESGTIQQLRNNITNCYSTSDRPNVYQDSYTDITLIPALQGTSTVNLLEIENKISADQRSSNLTVKVDTSLNGKLLVWLDNTNNYIRPNVDCRYPYVNSPPAIGRLLIFKFSSSIESAPLEVLFGEWGELQFESNYTVIDAWIAKTQLSTSSIVLTTPNPPRIVQILCSLGSGTDHLWLQLKGRSLPKGKYSVQLSYDRWFTVEFDGSKDETTQNMFSSLCSEPLFGTGSKLRFGYTYKMTYIKLEDETNSVILDPRELPFKTPYEQPRLTSVGPVSFKDNLTKDTILIPLTGGISQRISLPVTFSDGETSMIEVVVYSKDASDTKLRSTNEIKLKYGEIYTVEELITGTTKCLFETAFSIQVPAEPKRIEKGWVTLNEGKDEATLILKGRVLTAGSYTLILNSVSQELTSEGSLSDDGELLFKVQISTLPTSILTFGETYTISSLKIEDENVVVNSDVELAVPPIPKVSMASCYLDAVSNTKFTVSLSGSSLPTSGSFVVSFVGLSQTITVTMSSTGGLSSLVEVSKATEIRFAHTYTLSSMVKKVDGGEDEHILCSGVTMRTPDGPSLLRVDPITLKEDDLNRVVLGVSFENMVGGSFEMKVKKSGTSTEYILSSQMITTLGSSTGTLTEIVYESGKLEYGESYTIVSLESSALPILIKDTAGFTIPPAPARIKTCSSVLGGVDKKSVILTMGGVNLPVGKEMTVTMKELNGEELVGSSITVSWTWEGSGTVSSGDVSVLVYGADPVRLRYETSYCLTSLAIADTPSILDPKVTFTVDDEPARVEGATPTLTPLRKSVIVELSGRELESGSYSVTLSSHPLNPISGTSASGVIRFEVSTVTTDPVHLVFGDTITVVQVKHGLDKVFVNSDVTFTVPNPPIVKTAHVHPNSINTSMTLELTGTDLRLDGFYTVTLSPLFSLDMLFNNSETISSAELLLGRTGSLQHSTAYTIESITRVGTDSDVIQTEGVVSFTTPKLEDDELCGESDDACATIDFAWSIVNALKAKSATLAIVNSSEQSQPIVVSSGMSILFRNGGNLEPTLTIPSSASLGDKSGMVVVDNAGFEVDDVTVRIESSDPSFVFLSATESTIILKDGSFLGEPLPTLTSNSDHENVCSWESGIIRLNNSVTTINGMTFSSLSQGAIHMKTGAMTFRESSFDGNNPNLASFPSARRNIRCVEEGNVTIGSLSGGDGSKDHPSAWISTTDCTVSGDDARPNSPLFVPTLSSESNSTWIKKEKRFSVLVVGTTMIPCGLCLEVFEMKKDKSEGESERVELSFDTTDSFNDTHITLSVALTSLSSLNDALEWRGRLVFGLNETTSESFIVQKSSADRKAESPLEHMKWWLPLVIVLLCCALVVIIVIVVILRRRRKQKDSEAQHESGQEMDSDKIEVEELDETEVRTSVNGLKGGSLDPEIGDASTVIHATQLDGQLSDCVSVLDCGMLEAKEMSKMETLFERLHKNKTRIVGKRQRQIELARGLEKIGKTNGNAPILRKLTSHWILIGADGHFNLKLKEEGETGRDHHSQTQTQTGGSIVGEEGGSVDVHKENANGMDRAAKEVREKEDQEGQRWQAPEQGGMDGMESCDVEKVTVFRLGLVLWEMETGQIPFRETDGVNAGRQLKSGVKPHMDLVGNKEMEELLLKCLELKATDRIGLDEVISSLDSIPDDPVPTQQLFNS